jgi:choline kinase
MSRSSTAFSLTAHFGKAAMTDCLILAAGRGSRMGQHSIHLPKCMVPFLGNALLDWQFKALKAAGIDEVNLVCGYRGEAFADLAVCLWENPKWATTNMVESMFCARPLLESAGALIVSYSDIIYEARIVRTLLGRVGNIAVTVDRNWRKLWEMRSDNPLADAESLRMNQENLITDIGRKVTEFANIQAQFMGLLYFDRTGLDHLISFYDSARTGDAWLEGREKNNCYMTDILRGLVESGHAVRAVPVSGGWLEFDTADDLDCYETLASTGQLSNFINFDKMQ